jgi:hypothetical protein
VCVSDDGVIVLQGCCVVDVLLMCEDVSEIGVHE